MSKNAVYLKVSTTVFLYHLFQKAHIQTLLMPSVRRNRNLSNVIKIIKLKTEVNTTIKKIYERTEQLLLSVCGSLEYDILIIEKENKMGSKDF